MPKYLDGAGLSHFWNNIKGSIGNASQEQVNAWLDEHPEATTTVQDGSITTPKLAQDIEINVENVVTYGQIRLDGTKVEDKAWRIDASGPTTSGSSYEYVDFSLIDIPASQLIVTGTSYGYQWPLITFYNSSSEIISAYGRTGGTRWTDEYVDVPEGAVRCVVNGAEAHNVVVRYSGVTETQAEFNERIDGLLIDAERKYLFIGDSYSQGYSHDGNNDGWTSYLVGYMGLSSDEFGVSNRGGASFATANNSFLQLLQSASGSGYTDIVVCGGFNDYNKTQSDIEAAIATFCQTAQTMYPNARVHVGEVAYIKQGSGSSAYSNWQDVRTNIETVVVPAYQSVVKYGGRYLNNVEYLLGENGLTPTDGYHPSAAGNMAIAAGVANALLTGSAQLPYNSALRAQ